MWSNVLSAALCPHLRGMSCSVAQNENHPSNHVMSQTRTGNAQGLMTHAHMHCTDSQMGDMDMPEMSVSEASTPESKPDELELALPATPISSLSKTVRQAITPESESCPYCMMHSQADAAISSAISNPSNSTRNVIAGQCCLQIVELVCPGPGQRNLHDHGPPGLPTPRYVLNSVFRI